MPFPIVGLIVGTVVAQGAFNWVSNSVAKEKYDAEGQALLDGQEPSANIHARNDNTMAEWRDGGDDDSTSDEDDDSSMNPVIYKTQ